MALLRIVASTAIFGAVLIVASALPATSDAAPSALLSLPSVELQPFVSGLTSPVHVTNAGDGSNGRGGPPWKCDHAGDGFGTLGVDGFEKGPAWMRSEHPGQGHGPGDDGD